jgi:hypothetical protein
VDEEAARRRPVRDNALGAHAQGSVRVLLVRGYPAVGVAAPAELGESLVEALGERGQHDLEVEVARPHPSEASPPQETVQRGRRDVRLTQVDAGGPPRGGAPAAQAEAA